MTIKVNGREAEPENFGQDWEWALSHFGLELPAEDDSWVEATITYRPPRADDGTCGAKRVDLVKAGYTQTVEFGSRMAKIMAVRHYTIARHNGAPPIVARWMVDRECQRLLQATRDEAFTEHSFSHLRARFKDTREEGEIESENAYEAERLLNEHTVVEPDEGLMAWWEWSDGELWLRLDNDEYEGE